MATEQESSGLNSNLTIILHILQQIHTEQCVYRQPHTYTHSDLVGIDSVIEHGPRHTGTIERQTDRPVTEPLHSRISQQCPPVQSESCVQLVNKGAQAQGDGREREDRLTEENLGPVCNSLHEGVGGY